MAQTGDTIRTIHVVSVRLDQMCVQMNDLRPYNSLASRSSNLSISLPTSVSISAQIPQICIPEISRMNSPTSNDCLAMPREASRPAKLPYIPSSRTLISRKYCERIVGTWSVKISTGRHVEYFPVNGKKDLAAVLAVEGLQRLGRVSLEDKNIWVGCWDPIIPL